MLSKKFCLFFIPLFVTVPVISVYFKCDAPHRDEEIDAVSFNPTPLLEIHTKSIKFYPHKQLDRCFPTMLMITRRGAEPTCISNAGLLSKNFMTHDAGDVRWRTVAPLGTILLTTTIALITTAKAAVKARFFYSLLTNAVNKFRSYYGVRGSISLRAFTRANFVPVSDAGGSLERSTANSTNLIYIALGFIDQVTITRTKTAVSQVISSARSKCLTALAAYEKIWMFPTGEMVALSRTVFSLT